MHSKKKLALGLIVILTAASAEDLNNSSVLFDFNSAELNHSQQAKLNSLQVEANLTQVAVDGYADKLGVPSLNQNLSQNRADNVKNQLIAKNIDPNIISAIGHSSANSKVSDQCISKFGADKTPQMEKIQQQLAAPKFHQQPLAAQNSILEQQLKIKLARLEKRQARLESCTAPDRRVEITTTSATSIMPAAATLNQPYNGSGAYINLNSGYGSQQFLSNGASATTLNVGYNFNRGLALEGGYALVAGQQYGVDSAQSIFDLAIKGTLPLASIFALYGRLGAGFSTFTYNGTQHNGPAWFTNSSGIQNSMVGLVTLGGSFVLDRHFDLRLEDSLYLPLDTAGSQTLGATNLALLGVQYNF